MRLRLDGVICGSPVGLRAARAALWDKKTQLVRARLQRACWRMHDSMSTRAIPRSSVAKAPVDKRVANILATPGKIQTAPPTDSNPSFAVEFCHVLFSWTSKMPVHCTEHQDAFFYKLPHACKGYLMSSFASTTRQTPLILHRLVLVALYICKL